MAEAAGKEEVFLTIKDKFGVEHKLFPLDMEDISDLEEILGPFGEWLSAGIKAKNFIRILWASMRKDGLTKDEILDGKWKLRATEVGRMFDASGTNLLSEAVIAVLEISGFKATKQGVSGEVPTA